MHSIRMPVPDLRGLRGMRAPLGFKFFQCHGVLGKYGKIVSWHPPEGWCPHLREILDLPLDAYHLLGHLCCMHVPLAHMPPTMHAPCHAHPLATHTPAPTMHTPCHTYSFTTHAPCHVYPLPCMPPVMYASLPHIPTFHHACPPLPCTPLLPCMPAFCHACPLGHTCPPPATHTNLSPCMPSFAMHTPFTMHARLLPCMPPWPYMAPPLPWTDGMIHPCENITFPQLLLRAVKMLPSVRIEPRTSGILV